MKILGIESSSLVASVAIVEDDIILAEYIMNDKKTHSQTLLPMLDELKKMIQLDLDTIDAIAVSSGPGSYTGLRIGSATAKGLGLALQIPLIHIPTVDAMAYNFYGTQRNICPIMDARRGQVYTGLYTFQNEEFVILQEQVATTMEEQMKLLNERGEAVVFLGDGVPVFRDYIEEKAKVPVSFAPAHLSRQRGSSVAALGLEYYKQGKIMNAGELAPEYLRLSQAERERLEGHKHG